MLVTIRESPQASTGFTSFELLFDQLDVMKEAWEEQPPPFQLIIKFVQEMQEQNAHATPIVREHMQMAQREQQRDYPAHPQKFQLGDHMLLLLSRANCNFLKY